MKPLIKDPKKRAKAKKALRVIAAIQTSGGSEVARAKMKVAQKAAGAVIDKVQKKDGGTMREKKMNGGMQKAARTKANMGRMMYKNGGQPEYKSGDMPKAKPC